jgi:hypothetical protein
MAQTENELPEEVEEAMDTVYHPGLWEYRDGEIIIGIDGNFNGYELSAAVIKEQMEAWQVLARHYGIIED